MGVIAGGLEMKSFLLALHLMFECMQNRRRKSHGVKRRTRKSLHGKPHSRR